MFGASAVPSRGIQSTTAGSPSNMHGIAYVASTDQIIATDVGDAGSAEDGMLYVIDNGMSVIGSVAPRLTISGAESMLGNPVDLAFDGSSALIAEKSNNALLVYNNILNLTGNLSMAADEIVPLPKPEGVSLLAQ